jgi:lysophospholipase L1-like esterase
MKKTLFIICLTALLGTLPANAQVDFSRYVALGDSLTAGVASGSLHMDYQQTAYPALLAQQAGASVFEMPLISDPGIPHIWELVSLLGPTFETYPNGPIGMPINAEYALPYNNLGVPGSNLYDLLFTTGDITNLLQDPPIMDNAEHDLVLRIPMVPDPTDPTEMIDFTAITQAIALDPTFITLWIGNNDILGAAVYGTPLEGVTMRPLEGEYGFTNLYQQALGALATMTSADIVVINLPYATDAPIINTVSPFLTLADGSVVPIIGTNGPLDENCYVTLPGASWLAQYYDPLNGVFLPEDIDPVTGAPGYVLRPEEVAIINGRIDAYNAIIQATADAFGIPVLDFNDFLHRIATGEEEVAFGGWEPTTDFLTGGIFSYDGVHPEKVGQGLVALELIDLINEEFGASIPPFNMSHLMCSGGCENIPIVDPDKAHEAYTLEAFAQLLTYFPLLGEPTVSLDQGALAD